MCLSLVLYLVENVHNLIERLPVIFLQPLPLRGEMDTSYCPFPVPLRLMRVSVGIVVVLEPSPLSAGNGCLLPPSPRSPYQARLFISLPLGCHGHRCDRTFHRPHTPRAHDVLSRARSLAFCALLFLVFLTLELDNNEDFSPRTIMAPLIALYALILVFLPLLLLVTRHYVRVSETHQPSQAWPCL